MNPDRLGCSNDRLMRPLISLNARRDRSTSATKSTASGARSGSTSSRPARGRWRPATLDNVSETMAERAWRAWAQPLVLDRLSRHSDREMGVLGLWLMPIRQLRLPQGEPGARPFPAR